MLAAKNDYDGDAKYLRKFQPCDNLYFLKKDTCIELHTKILATLLASANDSLPDMRGRRKTSAY